MRALIGLAALLASFPAQAQIRAPLTITEADYPDHAQRNGLVGRAMITVDVRDNGTVSACSIAQSSGYGQLDDQSCALYLARARFDPVPAKRKLQAPVRWQLTGRSAPDLLHVLAGFGTEYPDIRIGASYAPADLSARFPRCEANDGEVVRAIVTRSPTWLGAGNVEGLALVLQDESYVLVNVSVVIAKSWQGEVRRILETRLGKPCFAATTLTVWINGPTYVALGPQVVAIFQRDGFDWGNYDAACKPPPL